jgi:hypothetical protein
MLLTQMLISMACQNIQTYANHQDACNRFLTESTQKIGLYGTDQKVEDYLTVKAKDEAVSDFGKAPLEVGGGLAYTYRVYKNKAVDFKLPTMGVADTISNHITPNSYSLNLSWKMSWLK